jgi:hypothetical protein
VLFQLQDQKVPTYFTDVPEGTYSNQLVNREQQSKEWLLASNVETFGTVSILTAQQKLADELRATALAVRITIPLVDMGIERKIGSPAGAMRARSGPTPASSRPARCSRSRRPVATRDTSRNRCWRCRSRCPSRA